MTILGVLVVVNLYVFVWDKKLGVRAIRQQAEAQPTLAMPSAPLAPVPPPPPPAQTAGPAAPIAAITGKIGKSDTLGKLLKKNGLSAAETDEVIRALSGVLDFRTIKNGEAYRIERGADRRVKLFQLDLATGHRVRAERQVTGELVGVGL